jgi:hypothetical protein
MTTHIHLAPLLPLCTLMPCLGTAVLFVPCYEYIHRGASPAYIYLYSTLSFSTNVVFQNHFLCMLWIGTQVGV